MVTQVAREAVAGIALKAVRGAGHARTTSICVEAFNTHDAMRVGEAGQAVGDISAAVTGGAAEVEVGHARETVCGCACSACSAGGSTGCAGVNVEPETEGAGGAS
jgi:hypothetical protein